MFENKVCARLPYILMAFMWLLVFIPKEMFAIISICLVIVLLCYGLIDLRDKVFLLCASITLVHCISIIIAVFSHNDITIERVIAAFNTAIIWIVGGALFTCFKRINIDSKKMCIIGFINICLMSLLCLIAIFLSKKGISISFLGRTLFRDDWLLGEKSFRVRFFLEYDTLTQFFVYVNSFFILYHSIKNKKISYILISSILCVFCVFWSKSRFGLVLTIIYYFLALIIYFKKFLNFKLFALSSIIFVSIFIFFALIYTNEISTFFYELFNSRSSSNSTRLLIYRESINAVFPNNAMFGCGIKIMYGEFPLGSHSSFVGILYKCGLIGSILFLFFIILLLLEMKKNRKNNIIYSTFLMIAMLFMILEDIDGTNWIILYFMLIIGLNYRKQELNI